MSWQKQEKYPPEKYYRSFAYTEQVRGHLTKPEFYVACKLVAVRQNNGKLDLSATQSAGPLPKLHAPIRTPTTKQHYVAPPATPDAQPAPPAATNGPATAYSKLSSRPLQISLDQDGHSAGTGADQVRSRRTPSLPHAYMQLVLCAVRIRAARENDPAAARRIGLVRRRKIVFLFD